METEVSDDVLEDIHKNPSFFRVRTESGREIYFLGVVHRVPFENLLSKKTRDEISRIHRNGARLFLEHEMNNEFYLEFLDNEQYISSIDDRSRFLNEYELHRHLGILKRVNGESRKIFIREGNRSEKNISAIEK